MQVVPHLLLQQQHHEVEPAAWLQVIQVRSRHAEQRLDEYTRLHERAAARPQRQRVAVQEHDAARLELRRAHQGHVPLARPHHQYRPHLARHRAQRIEHDLGREAVGVVFRNPHHRRDVVVELVDAKSRQLPIEDTSRERIARRNRFSRSPGMDDRVLGKRLVMGQ